MGINSDLPPQDKTVRDIIRLHENRPATGRWTQEEYREMNNRAVARMREFHFDRYILSPSQVRKRDAILAELDRRSKLSKSKRKLQEYGAAKIDAAPLATGKEGSYGGAYKPASHDRSYRQSPDFDCVLEKVCRDTGFTASVLLSKTRNIRVVRARHQLMYEVYHNVVGSLSAVARLLNMDHTTIKYGIEKHEKRLKGNK